MSNPDYFFLIFLGALVVIRLFAFISRPAPTIKGFRMHHYMFGVPLLVVALIFHNLFLYVVSLALMVDELALVLLKGPGHKEEAWNGCEEYHKEWSLIGALFFTFFVYLFRATLLNFLI